jgi:hypothetical protein
MYILPPERHCENAITLWLQRFLPLRLELLLHELPQGTVEWRDSAEGGRVKALIKIDHLAVE